MNKLILMLIILGAIFFLQKQRINTIVNLNAEANEIIRKVDSVPNACQNKKYCFTAYLAPYCTICQGKIPVLKDLIAKSKSTHSDYGIKIIVGRGGNDENAAMAKNFGQDVIIDNDSSFSDKLQVSRVPYFKLSDSNNNTMAEEYDALNWVYKKMN